MSTSLLYQYGSPCIDHFVGYNVAYLKRNTR